MVGEQFLMNTDEEALRRELMEAMDKVLTDSLRAFGIEFKEPQELKGRLGKQRVSTWEPGRYTYIIDGKPFLNMTTRWSPQSVRLSWVSIDRKARG